MKETSIQKYERLLTEETEVKKRMQTLEEFLNSDDSFEEINVNQRGLIRLYLLSTEYYLEVLQQRIVNAYTDHYNEVNGKSEYENPLLAPANYSLDVLLNELKRGRPAASQHLIEKWVKELAD